MLTIWSLVLRNILGCLIVILHFAYLLYWNWISVNWYRMVTCALSRDHYQLRVISLGHSTDIYGALVTIVISVITFFRNQCLQCQQLTNYLHDIRSFRLFPSNFGQKFRWHKPRLFVPFTSFHKHATDDYHEQLIV